MSAPVRSTTRTTAGVEQVFALVTSPEWVAAKAERFSDGSTVVRREERPGGGVVLAVSRELPAGAPGYLSALLPQDGRVQQVDEWGPPQADGSRSGTWRVEIAGAPARMGGTLRIEPSPGGATYDVEGEATVSVPLVGGRAERFVAEMVSELGAREGALLTQTLART